MNARNMQEAAPFCLRIIRLFNEYDIPLDHALLALDLARLSKPDSANTVRRDWGPLAQLIVRRSAVNGAINSGNRYAICIYGSRLTSKNGES